MPPLQFVKELARLCGDPLQEIRLFRFASEIRCTPLRHSRNLHSFFRFAGNPFIPLEGFHWCASSPPRPLTPYSRLSCLLKLGR